MRFVRYDAAIRSGVDRPAQRRLAALHAKRHLIRENRCYTCHTDYDLLGGIRAKVRGMQHLYGFYFGDAERRPELYAPYSDNNCLHCHQGGVAYEESPTHLAIAEELKSGEALCLECHGPAHPVGDE